MENRIYNYIFYINISKKIKIYLKFVKKHNFNILNII